MSTTYPKPFNHFLPGETASSPWCYEVTPSDTLYLDFVTREIKIKGIDGDIKVELEHGEVQTIPVEHGERETIKAVRIYATGTTATEIWVYA